MADQSPEEPEKPEDSADLERPPSFFPYSAGDEEETGYEGSSEPIKVRVEAVLQVESGEGNQYFLLLADGRQRKLPILIGQFEASAITIAIEDKQPDRPMTHDLLRNVIARLGAHVDRVVIDDLFGSTFYAKIFIRHDGAEFMIDSRPSDGVALAVRTNASIYVADGILEQHDA